MTELLVDYTQFEAPDLAKQLHDVVDKNRKLLEDRYFLGVIARYGADLDLAEKSVIRGQKNHEPGVSEHFAVVNSNGNVVGAASTLYDLPLTKLRLPIPPIWAVGPLSQSFDYANPNISAWTDIDEGELLVAAFAKMANDNDPPRINGERHKSPWVIEPKWSPRHIHTAIKMAGLTKVATRIFDDQESRHRVPKISTLYSKSTADWATSHGRQKELQKGKWKSYWQALIEDLDEHGAHYTGIER